MAVVNGTSGNDTILPDFNNGPWFFADTVFLFEGNDFVDSSLGDDFVDAGSGNDTVEAGGGNDFVLGQSGNDFLIGGQGNDTLYGGADDDTIEGGVEDDFLFGDAGNDTFLHNGVAGWDHYSGGTGNDTILLNQLNPFATFGLINISSLDSIEFITNATTSLPVDIGVDGSVDFSGTQIAGIRNIVGQSADDTIVGSTQDNSILGGDGNDGLDGWSGNDSLSGGAGEDVLIGNVGNDTLTGGAGADQFVFIADNGLDIVTDFEDGTDQLVFVSATALSFFDFNGDAAFELNNGTFVILEGIDVSLIDPTDYAFL